MSQAHDQGAVRESLLAVLVEEREVGRLVPLLEWHGADDIQIGAMLVP